MTCVYKSTKSSVTVLNSHSHGRAYQRPQARGRVTALQDSRTPVPSRPTSTRTLSVTLGAERLPLQS